MSIANEIQRLQTAKANIKAAIESKGVTVPSSTTIDGYAQLINSIPSPTINGHEFVDLGLPSGTIWAKCNVGASSETDYGSFYQYGKGASQYAATSGQSDYTGTENPLAASADTAAQVWGGSWHMPTRAQCKELTANTTQAGATINGVKGTKFTAQNGNYVFFPFAGEYRNGSKRNVDDFCTIWCSTPYDITYCYYLAFASSSSQDGANNRWLGFSVRPVVG